MSTEDRVKAAAKNVEGKVQEAFGEIVGDPQQQAEGQEKQTEAESSQAVENLKDKAKSAID